MQSSFTENTMLSSMGGLENEEMKQMKERVAELEAENKKLQSKNRKLNSINEGLVISVGLTT